MDSNINTKQWLDTLRAIATLGVIVIHLSSPLVKMSYGKNMSYWWIGNIMDSGVRFAVPIFLMLSGATLLAKEYRLNDFYKRRILRVLVPFLFWIVVYLIYQWLILKSIVQPHDLPSIRNWAVNLFLKEGISKHFWYIYMILFIYLFVPLLGKGLRKLSNPAIIGLLLGWVILTFICKGISFNTYNWSGGYLSKLFGYILFSGYLVFGYYFGKLPVNSSLIRNSAFAVFVLTILASSVLTYLFSRNVHKLDLSIYGYLSINTIVQSCALFLLVKDSAIKNKYLAFIQSTISSYSYGIYLVHIMVIGVFFNYGIFWTMANPLVSLPLLIITVLACSILIIYILRMIPFGKYISG